MKVLVTYHSDSGNTGKVAQAIFEGLDQVDKDIVPSNDVKGIEAYDLIFCGFPVQAHSVPPKMEAFIKNIPDGKNVAFFATHGSQRGGHLAISAFYHAIGLAPQERIMGTFGCRGSVKSSLIDALMKKPEHKAWAMEAQSAIGHPDSADLADAQEWANKMVAKARSL